MGAGAGTRGGATTADPGKDCSNSASSSLKKDGGRGTTAPPPPSPPPAKTADVGATPHGVNTTGEHKQQLRGHKATSLKAASPKTCKAVGSPSPPNVPMHAAKDGAKGCQQPAGVQKAAAEVYKVQVGARSNSRSFSIRSEEALSALLGLEIRLKQIEDRVAELDAFVRGPGEHPTGFGKAKTELAMLEADAHKLESTGVDNIYTGELESGKATAKETKKDQLRRLEALFSRIDDVFSVMAKSASAGSKTLMSPKQPCQSTPPHTPRLDSCGE